MNFEKTTFGRLRPVDGQISESNFQSWLKNYTERCYKKAFGETVPVDISKDSVAVGSYLKMYPSSSFNAIQVCNCINELKLYNLFKNFVNN